MDITTGLWLSIGFGQNIKNLIIISLSFGIQRLRYIQEISKFGP